MTTPKKKRSGKAGMPPGSLVHVGEKKQERARITLIDFDEKQVEEREVQDIAECFPFRDKPTVTWINIDGLHDVEVIERLGGHFNLHPLILEDILNTAERPKIEDYGDFLFAVLKVFLGNPSGGREERIIQASIILGRNFVLSFQEKTNPIFDAVKDRIRRGKGRLRRSGADYLAYALIDSIVDSYFAVLERFGDEIESLEEELVADPKREILQRIHGLKSEMIFLRRSIWPLREVVNTMERLETPLITASTDIFLRDVYDHTIQVIDNLETYRDVLSGMVETYLSSVSNRMNEVMKVLTIIATIFIPLTFLAGVYGMNFKFMPELEWKYGYFIVWGVMVVAAVVMIAFFKRKKWL
ncbi:MAG: magnesium/cobalt transporter CorA [Candidatus Aminicenantes bacterium]|nr:magnesium/cobalt transporter CorA [Candidatus Aminicenantes bacterium]